MDRYKWCGVEPGSDIVLSVLSESKNRLLNRHNLYYNIFIAKLLGGDNMPLLKEETYTIDDIYALPDGERAELIDGRMYMMAPPSRKHQRISTRLVSIIDRYIEEHKGKCEVYAAPFAVYLDERSNTYVEPDISVICDPDKLDDRGCKGAPDWIIEIVSPASKKMDYLLKLLKYRFAGVKEYWIVDPEKNRVIVYNFTGDESVNDYTLQDFVKVGIYEDFVIDFGSMEL